MDLVQCLQQRKEAFELITNYESDESDDSPCMICLEQVNDATFYRHVTNVIHKSCGELPGKINHPLHPQHPLKIYNLLDKQKSRLREFGCDVCFTLCDSYKYGCKICDERFCYPCISKYVEGQELRERVEKFTPYHPHNLQLMYLHPNWPPTSSDEYIECLCCLKGIRDSIYICYRCDEFWSHESCISDIPEQIKSLFHPKHSLTLQHLRPRTTLKCKACRGDIRQVQLGCSICKCWFHVSCGQYTLPGLRVNGDFTLFYINESMDNYWCDICRKIISEGPMYRGLELEKNFHVECLVPPVLDHPCHHRQLKLTSSVERENEAEKYRCDVCEEEEDFEHYVYHCEDGCYFNAHIECLFSEEDKPLRIDLFRRYDKIEDEEKFNTEDEVEDSDDEIEYSDTEDDEEDEDSEEEEKKKN